MYPPEHRREVREALKQVRVPLGRLALEVLEAEQAGLSYADAAAQGSRFGLLARFHYGMVDLLQVVLSKEAASLVRHMLRNAQEPDTAEIRGAIFAVATGGDTPEAALARFVLYQFMRLGVWLATLDDPGGIEASGAMDEIDRVAEDVLQRELRAYSPAYEREPVPLMIAQCIVELKRVMARNDFELKQAKAVFVRWFNRVASAYRLAKDLDAPDAVLVRNEAEAQLGGEKLGAERLADRHPIAFPSADAVYQRACRMAKSGGPKRARGVRLVDLIREFAEEVA